MPSPMATEELIKTLRKGTCVGDFSPEKGVDYTAVARTRLGSPSPQSSHSSTRSRRDDTRDTLPILRRLLVTLLRDGGRGLPLGTNARR